MVEFVDDILSGPFKMKYAQVVARKHAEIVANVGAVLEESSY